MAKSDGPKRPPSEIGRFVQAARSIAWQRLREDPSKKDLASQFRPLRGDRLTREGLASLASYLSYPEGNGDEISSEDIRDLETGSAPPNPKKLHEILRGLLLTDLEIKAVMDDPEFTTATNNSGLGNTHFLPSEGRRILAVGIYGPQIDKCFSVGDFGTTWSTVEAADSGGFSPDEVNISVLDDNIATTKNPAISPPPSFKRLASEASRLNATRQRRGDDDCWTDNETLCLDSISSQLKDDREERNSITLRMYRSMYRFNYVAKSEQATEFRWKALQEAKDEIEPVNFLASGVGVCVNLLCDGGKSMVYGCRSNKETFRKGELDVAVVEGIRAKSDLRGNSISIHEVCLRGLDEEMGLNKLEVGKSAKDYIDRLCVFELGVDLTYYQWNFLAFATTNLSFEKISKAWPNAKSRKENARIGRVPFNRENVESFVTHNRIWSCGAACAIKTFEYL
jgi:hypothetical protein